MQKDKQIIKHLDLKNFTVFADANIQLGSMNVFHGENGTSKTHLLKLLYTALAVLDRGASGDEAPVKTRMQRDIAEKLVGVFKPDKLGRLARRTRGHKQATIGIGLDAPTGTLEFSFSTGSATEVAVATVPPTWQSAPPVFVPARELLSFQPEFVGLFRERNLPFDMTWLDTSLLLNAPLTRGPRVKRIKELLEPLEEAMGGWVETDQGGHFYLKNKSGQFEMQLVAEGLRKLEIGRAHV